MKSKFIYEEEEKNIRQCIGFTFLSLSKLGIGERRSIDLGLTSQLQTTTFPHMFFLSNGPPYPGIRLGMFVSLAIGEYRWVDIPTGHTT